MLREKWLTEPVRTRLYAALVALVALLVTLGFLDDTTAGWVTAAFAVLVGVPAVESARAAVIPLRDARLAVRAGKGRRRADRG